MDIKSRCGLMSPEERGTINCLDLQALPLWGAGYPRWTFSSAYVFTSS